MDARAVTIGVRKSISTSGSNLKIAYLVNRHPAVSHTFIRREIEAVEAAGATVDRYSIRAPDTELPDARDREELRRVSIVLDGNRAKVLLSTLRRAFRSPIAFARALRLALSVSGPSPKTALRHVAYLAEACVLFERFRDRPVDHIHAHFGTNPAMVARLLRKLGGPPYSFTVHGPEEFDRPIELDLHGKIADSALAIAISSFGRSQLMRWSDPVFWPRLGIARCGVDDTYLQMDVEAAPVPNVARLCCVARLSGQKGLPLLIESAALLAARGVDFHLTLVGDGEMRPEIEAMIASHKLSDHISITGWASSETVREHILASRAMVLPSFAEGLPVVIMEALALGRPVISTMIAGIPELVDRNCGWLIPAGSAELCADAMQDALAKPVEELAQMGREGRRRVSARHNAKANGAHLLELIRHSHRRAAE